MLGGVAAEEIARAAAVFRDARYEVKPLLRALLLSDAFWAPANRGTLVKSPVELVVGTLHTFEMRPVSLRPAVFACAMLGQNPFSPPNVKGWPGGEAWINSNTLLARKDYLDRVERSAINEALEKTRYNRTAAAKLLGITFRALRYKLKKLGIE